MERQQAGVFELGVAHEQRALCAVDVVPVQRDQFADPHPCGCEEADDRGVRGPDEREAQRPGRLHHGDDLLLCVEVRVCPGALARQQVRRRHLGRRVEALEVAGEATRDRQADGPLVGLAIACGRPVQGELCGEGGRPGRIQVADEARQKPAVALQLEAEGPAEAQVVVACLVERVHGRAPGQGRATRSRAARSTLA